MTHRPLLTVGALFAVLTLGCLGLGDKKHIETWLALYADYADCYGVYTDCTRAASTDAGYDACGAAILICCEGADDFAREADGDDGCISTVLDCIDGCEEESCFEDCRDDFEACADWYSRDCEDDCGDETDDCVEIAFAAYGSDMDALLGAVDDCIEEQYDDCIPACYEE